VMLLYSPYYLLYDIGFVFSFSAVLGLAKSWSYVRRGDSIRLLYPLKMVRNNYLLPSMGASVGVLPFLLFFVGSFNLLSIVANVVVLPVVPLVMVWGVLVALLGDGVWLLVWSLSSLVEYVFLVSDLVVSYGWYVVLKGKWFMILMLPWWIRWLLVRVR
jgi:competence protein ComEC